MLRHLYTELVAWKTSPRRKPLILKGARQVGKTYLLKEFAAKEYADSLYLNFEADVHLKAFFEEDLKPERILRDLAIYYKKVITPETCLLIFDEIQECQNALNSLKYFCESANQYPIVAAGSLLGVKLTQTFPVGKVNFLQLNPMSFFEFLTVMGETALMNYLNDAACHHQIMSQPFHERLLKWLKYYYIIGGMPEVVKAYQARENFEEVRIIQQEILDTYTLDFAKHALPHDVMKIMAIWQLIPAQLAKENKKFVFTAIRHSARGREYEAALQWLVEAGLIIKVHAVETAKLPLKAYMNSNAFKIYALDVGLLGAMSHLDPRIILEGNRLFEEFKGALTENFAAQTLHLRFQDTLYYWTSAGTAEVDFVITTHNTIFPLEVKSGLSKHKKSLQVFGQKYLKNEDTESPVVILSRANPQPFAYDYDKHFMNYPLYALALFPIVASVV